MTEQPIAPTPAAAAPAAPAAPAPAPTPAAFTSATDPAAEVARLQAELDRARGHARTWEDRAKANENAAPKLTAMEQQLAAIAKHVGLPDTAPDPEAVVRQLQAAQAEKADLARQNAVLLAAHTAGADAAALLDSKSFLNAISNVDPTDIAAVKAAVEAGVAANPRYAVGTPTAPAAPPPPPAATVTASAAGSFGGSPGAARQLTAQDVAGMSGAELSKAAKQGLLANYFATPNGT